MSEEGSPRILIILMGSLGDICRGLAVLPLLQERFPDGHITWVVQESYRDMLQLLVQKPDRILVYERKKGLRGIFNFGKLAQEIFQQTFDITLDMQRIAKSALLSICSRAPRRIGFHRKNSKEGNWLVQTEYIPFRDEAKVPKIEQYRDFALALGCTERQIYFPKFCFDEMNRRTKIGIIVGSSWKSKDWPLRHYQTLLQILGERFPHEQVVLLGTRDQVNFANQLCDGSKPVVDNKVGKTSLGELLEQIHQCKVVLGPDSGPGHMAAALGVPTVTLFGPTEAARVAPFGEQARAVISPISCAPCLRRVCPGLGNLCMHSILPERVIEMLVPHLQVSRDEAESGV
jgi:ADP-heptose:LPS heptosyltransferase